MTLKEAREQLAALLSQLEYGPEGKRASFRVTPRPRKGNLRRGDGFVTFRSNTTGEFIGSYLATLSGWLILGSDESLADADVDELAVLVNHVVADWGGMDITVETQSIIGGESFQGETYVIVVTCSVDVE